MQRIKPISPFIIYAIVGWVIYACVYIILKNIIKTNTFAGYFSLVGEVGLDIVMATLTFELWKKCEEQDAKNI